MFNIVDPFIVAITAITVGANYISTLRTQQAAENEMRKFLKQGMNAKFLGAKGVPASTNALGEAVLRNLLQKKHNEKGGEIAPNLPIFIDFQPDYSCDEMLAHIEQRINDFKIQDIDINNGAILFEMAYFSQCLLAPFNPESELKDVPMMNAGEIKRLMDAINVFDQVLSKHIDYLNRQLHPFDGEEINEVSRMLVANYLDHIRDYEFVGGEDDAQFGPAFYLFKQTSGADELIKKTDSYVSPDIAKSFLEVQMNRAEKSGSEILKSASSDLGKKLKSTDQNTFPQQNNDIDPRNNSRLTPDDDTDIEKVYYKH